jgi:hypothetical protein
MDTSVNIGRSQDFRLCRALLVYGKSDYNGFPYRHPFVVVHDVVHDGDSARLAEGQLVTPDALRDIMTHRSGFEETVKHLFELSDKDLRPLSEYLPAQMPGPITASWIAQGRFLPGEVHSGNRMLVYAGPISTPILEDVLKVQFSVDGTLIRRAFPVTFHFEMEEN